MDAYGADGGLAFMSASLTAGVSVRTIVRLSENSEADLVTGRRQLQQSGARVIVLFALARIGSRFVNTAWRGGIGGEGYLWMCSYSGLIDLNVWEGDAASHEQAFRGSMVVDASTGQGTATHDSYIARRRQLPPMSFDDGSCNLETDSTGQTYLWARDDDGNSSTPLRCSGDSPEVEAMYDAFGYDAVLAVAHALHNLIEVQQRAEIVGRELLDALIQQVRFEGVTGL
eukprot:4959962-Prymnesium_polylepis.1